MVRRILVVLLLVALTATGGTASGSAPVVEASAPADFRALVLVTWHRFTDAFAARGDCLAPVTVAGAWELPDRATYDPERRLVTVRIPGTAPNLQASLVHEFAHHLEYTCPALRELRSAFLAAQGLPLGSAWRMGPTWESVPAEQFAEATVRLVLGPSARTMVLVRPAAVSVLRAWVAGDLIDGP